MARLYRLWLFVFAAGVAAGCSGASGGGPETPKAQALTDSTSVAVGSSARTAAFLAGPSTVLVNFPKTSGGAASMTLQGSASLPSGDPALTATMYYAPATPGAIYQPVVSGSVPTPVPVAFFTVTASAAVAFASLPVISLSLPAGAPTTGVSYFLGYYDPAESFWDLGISGPSSIGAATVVGAAGSVSFSTVTPLQVGIGTTPPVAAAPDPLTYAAGRTYGFAVYSQAVGSI